MHKHVRDNLPGFKKGRKRIKCGKFHIQFWAVQQVKKDKNNYIEDDDIPGNWRQSIKHILKFIF